MIRAIIYFVIFTCGISFLLALAGCVPVPVKERTYMNSRTGLNDEDLAFVVEKITTREELLLHLGEPDAVLNNESILVYSWSKVVGGIVLLIPPATGGVEMLNNHYLIFEFDSDGTLQRFKKGVVAGGLFTLSSGDLDKIIRKDFDEVTPSNTNPAEQ